MQINQQPWYYQILDIPSLPTELEQQLWNLFRDPNKEQQRINHSSYNDQKRPELANKPGFGDIVGVRDGEPVHTARTNRYQLPSQVQTWVDQHLTVNCTDVGMTILWGDKNKTMLPHTDLTRNYAIMYTIDPGGSDARVDFWQAEGHDIHREMREYGLDYSKLKNLLSVKWPLKKWILINPNILHSVERMTAPRVQIQMGIDIVPNIAALHTEWIKSGAQ